MTNSKKYLKEAKLVLCLILFGAHLNFSQTIENYKLFTGEVVSDTLNISGLHVINKTSGAKSITDKVGVFKIGVKKNDTIVISSIQTKTKVIIVNSKIFNQDLITIYLEPFVNELENVEVRPHNLTGNIFNDMNNSGVKNDINFSDVGIPGFKGKRAEKIVYKNDMQILLNVLLLPVMPLDIEGVYKQLSGYYEVVKKGRILDKKYNSVTAIIEFYGLNFFIKNYNLENSEVYEFVVGAMENSDIEENYRLSNHSLILKSFDEFYNSYSNEKN